MCVCVCVCVCVRVQTDSTDLKEEDVHDSKDDIERENSCKHGEEPRGGVHGRLEPLRHTDSTITTNRQLTSYTCA